MKVHLAPVAKFIGFQLIKVKKGAVTCRMLAKKQHENMIGTLHCGILCDVADAAMGYAFLTWLKPQECGVTVEFKINFLKPVRTGERITASAKTLSRGRSLYYLECEIRNAKKQLIAKASSTCKVIRPVSGESAGGNG